MRIRWTPAAAADLEDIHNYFTKYHPDWARGRNARELLHPRLPYIVAYRVKEAAVEILHIRHAARDRIQ